MSVLCLIVLGVLALTLVTAATGGRPTGADKARTCFGKRPTTLGTRQGESISGTKRRDVIISLGGRDYINAREGDDFVCAGSGDDVVHGSEGFNRLNGGPGDDWLDGRRGRGNVAVGGKGEDYVQAEGKIDGGAGDDWIEGYGYFPPSKSPFPDVSSGGPGNDKIYGCGGTTAAQRPATAPPESWAWPDCFPPRGKFPGGAPSAELLKGGLDGDKVFGGARNDQLLGNGGADRLYGEDGDDDLDGGPGTDTCDQGAGTGSLTSCP
jgi:Ca2+-binding RTX toxin-like protein